MRHDKYKQKAYGMHVWEHYKCSLEVLSKEDQSIQIPTTYHCEWGGLI